MSAADQAATRAPRLTENRLEDLAEVVIALDADLEWLRSCVGEGGTVPKGTQLHAKLLAKHGKLQRGRDWIAGKLEAERSQRAAGAQGGGQ